MPILPAVGITRQLEFCIFASFPPNNWIYYGILKLRSRCSAVNTRVSMETDTFGSLLLSALYCVNIVFGSGLPVFIFLNDLRGELYKPR